MLFVIDIASRGDLVLDAVVEVLKLFEEKENLFANFPIGATIQDGGKRKRNDDLLIIITQKLSYINIKLVKLCFLLRKYINY